METWGHIHTMANYVKVWLWPELKNIFILNLSICKVFKKLLTRMNIYDI
jgi:hypothetical protein